MAKSESEIWKSHPNIPGIEVSSFGRVRTLDKVVSSERIGTRFIKGRVLKPASSKDGYLGVAVKVNDKFISKKVHRLTAQTFVPNPDNLPQINHKDNDSTNNAVSNLEWCTGEYNIQYREKYGKALNHPVYAVNSKTSKVSWFKSQHEASRELGILQQSINAVVNGKQDQTHGYLFVNDDDNAYNTIKDRDGKMIDGVFVKNSDLEEKS